ncbi:MAG TPA: radical SAM family heme chaperone HemW [Bacteroidetes bacterium]|nr:radical SAM family heme chaperone HemW [Bacteroidota bacterium]
MGGIYIHIPYCKQKCSYCNFYFSVSMKTKEEFIFSLLKEIDLNHHYLDREKIRTLYFGGGTPSILSTSELKSIIAEIKKYFVFSEDIEITIEANPDDINIDYLKAIKELGITRFSLGVQSFHDNELKILNRSHDAHKAICAIEMIKNEGFKSTNIDLIFGIPGSTITEWRKNLDFFYKLEIPHLSCYNLTIENRTAIYHQIKTGKLSRPDDKLGAEMFVFTHDYLTSKGYDHYEISNYAIKNNMAIHNTNYWKGEKYLGLGPSAHSFNGESRQWNISNVRKYIHDINSGFIPMQEEKLNKNDMYNEYVMTGLRTKWGVDIKKIESFGDKYKEHFVTISENYIRNGFIIIKNDAYILTVKGMLYSDKISSDLFVT